MNESPTTALVQVNGRKVADHATHEEAIPEALMACATTSTAAITVEDMARRLDCSIDRILRAVKNLEAKGLLTNPPRTRA